MQVHCCPICGKKIVGGKEAEHDAYFPFCGERCQMVDLGYWFSDEYVIRGESQQEAGSKAEGEET